MHTEGCAHTHNIVCYNALLRLETFGKMLDLFGYPFLTRPSPNCSHVVGRQPQSLQVTSQVPLSALTPPSWAGAVRGCLRCPCPGCPQDRGHHLGSNMGHSCPVTLPTLCCCPTHRPGPDAQQLLQPAVQKKNASSLGARLDGHIGIPPQLSGVTLGSEHGNGLGPDREKGEAVLPGTSSWGL